MSLELHVSALGWASERFPAKGQQASSAGQDLGGWVQGPRPGERLGNPQVRDCSPRPLGSEAPCHLLPSCSSSLSLPAQARAHLPQPQPLKTMSGGFEVPTGAATDPLWYSC